MDLKVHLCKDDSVWTWNVAMRLTFHGNDRGEWALDDERFANLMAYERAGEFRIKFIGGVVKLECYDGVGTKGPVFSIYFAPVPETDRRPDSIGTPWPLALENPRDPAGIDFRAGWSVVSGPVLSM